MSTQEQSQEKLVLCPYCGHAQFGGDRCQMCAGLFEPLSRRATQLAMGPWQIRDKNSPFRPGCCYDIIKKMAIAGKIKSTTVMRGPTTRQFWSVARNVPGVSHLIGYCYQCGHHVSPSDAKCGDCGAVFNEPRERNTLGLVFKDDEEAHLGQQMLDAEIRGEPMPQRTVPGPTKRTRPKPAKAGDLLSDVLDLSGDLPGASPMNQPMGKPAASPATAFATPSSSRPPASPASQASPAGPASMPGPSSMPTPAPMNVPNMPASAFDTEPTKPLPEGEGISPMVLALIAANIIAIAVIVVFVVLNQ